MFAGIKPDTKKSFVQRKRRAQRKLNWFGVNEKCFEWGSRNKKYKHILECNYFFSLWAETSLTEVKKKLYKLIKHAQSHAHTNNRI